MKHHKSGTMLLIIVSLAMLLLAGCDSGAQPTATPAATAAPTAAATTALTPSATATTPADTTPVPAAHIDLATQAVTKMSQGDFAGVESDFDKTMQEKLPADQLKTVWDQVTGQYGAYKGQKGTTTGRQEGYSIVVVLTEFEKGDLNIRVVVDKDSKIAGLFFAPAAQSTPPAYAPPPYVDQSKFTERDVKVGSGEWELPGTLTLPVGQGPFPVVVLVQGSGPQDRDETIGLNKPFRDLAWGLASQGVAVLRYDKRTFVYGAKMAAAQDKITVKEEVVDDALLALAMLKKQEGIDPNRIFLLGHSLGAYLVPMILEQKPNAAGAIAMAGTTRQFEDVILDQYTYLFNLDGKVTDDEQKQLDNLKKQVERVKDPALSPSTPAADLPLSLPAKYWLSIKGYHPEQVAATQTTPLLIMQGERDYQVTLVDFDGWKKGLAARTNVEFKLYPKLNHIFREGEGMATPDEYNSPGHMSEEPVNDIAAWVKAF